MALRLGTSAAGTIPGRAAIKTRNTILGENKLGPNFSLARCYNEMNFEQEKSIGRRNSGDR
jgi:hypothetical protein